MRFARATDTGPSAPSNGPPATTHPVSAVPANASSAAAARNAGYTSPLNRALQVACTALTATRDKGEDYVRAQPLKSIAIVASVAALVGVLLSRR